MLLLFLLFIPGGVWAYERYAAPLELAKPDENGVYVFDMVVTKRLTMEFLNDNVFIHGTPVDYEPKTQTWTKRETDQTMECHLNYTMNPQTNPGDLSDLENVVVLDGLHNRVLTVNGKSPGPILVVPFGSEVLMKVTNNILLDSLTIHVHGINKQNLWYMDGVAYIQQCPITSSAYFEYRFIAENAGTHWYHGHFQTDRGDGLLGGFIVMKENRSVPTVSNAAVTPSREYFAILQDVGIRPSEDAWQMLDEKTMKWMYGYDGNDRCWQPTRTLAGGNVGGAVPISSLTVNDKGWHNQDDLLNQPLNLPLERFKIKANETVLFRVVNGGIAQELMLHFEGHQMSIVAADGDPCQPMQVDRLVIFPGERYDILIQGLANPTKRSYKMQLETMEYYWWDWTRAKPTFGAAFIEYEDESLPDGDTMTTSWSNSDCTSDMVCQVFNCPFMDFPNGFNLKCVTYDQLRTVTSDNFDPQIVQNTPFNGGYEEHFINMHYDSHVDGFKFLFPAGMPFYNQHQMNLISTNCSAVDCPKDASKYDRNCNCFYHKKHKLGNIVQMTMYNMGTGGSLGTGYAHPFHVHGTHFHVIKVGWPSYNASGMIVGMNPDIQCQSTTSVCDNAVWSNSSWMNGAVGGMITSAPSQRDTVTIPVGGYVTLRFRAVNPGWFFAHCHLELHTMGGTAYAYQVGEIDEIPQPPANFPHDCGYFAMPSIPKVVTSAPTVPIPTTTSDSTRNTYFIAAFLSLAAFIY